MRKRSYTSYYDYIDQCEKLYTPKTNLLDFKVDINGKNLSIDLPNNYQKTIKYLADVVEKKYQKKDYIQHPFLYKFKGMLDIPEVIALGNHFARELSEKLYGTEVISFLTHTFRSKITNLSRSSSWVWHYDNCAIGQIKFMIYLTPTYKENGAFQIIKKGDQCPLLKTMMKAPLQDLSKQERVQEYPGGRITDEAMKNFSDEGYEEFYVEGDSGTFVIFNPNIIHRANPAQKLPRRDVISFNFRPYIKRVDSSLDKKFTFDSEFRGKSVFYDYEIPCQEK